METKTCAACKEEKPLDGYYKNKNTADGLQSSCKPCLFAYQKQYRASARGREAYKRADEKWKIKNPEQRRKTKKQWRQRNPEKTRANNRKWRALKGDNYHETYSDAYIFERDGWYCGICGQKINKRLKWPNQRAKSIDHIIPLSRGGADAPINLQAAHLRCNQSKHANNGGQLRLIR